MATNSLEAQHRGLDVTGQNIANVNTPGYTRRVVDLVSVPPTDNSGAGRGVAASGIRSNRDHLLDRRLEQELPSERRDAAIAESLSVVEASLGRPGQSIDGKLSAFFDAFASLSENPQSAVARHEVQLQGGALAGAFRSMSDRFSSALRDTDTKIRGAVDEVNALAGRIAGINSTLAAAGANGSMLDLRDQQTQLVRQLSELVDIGVTERSGFGGVDITFGNGRPMVIGASAYAITASSVPPLGFAALVSGGSTVTTEITGGRLGGLLQVRDVTLPSYVDKLDTLAAQTVTEVNALHVAGFDQTGTAAGNFFAYTAPPVGVAGAAAAMVVDPAVALDATLIAAGGTAEAGDNTIARGLAALRDARVLDGGTASLTDYWSRLVYRVGRDSQAASDEQQTGQQLVRQGDALRDQVAGVSLDEEAMQLLRYQRAYEANARFFNTVSQTLDVLLQTLQ